MSSDQTSFLLIKPDGMREPLLEDFLARFEVLTEPIHDVRVQFAAQDVANFWYQYPESHRPVAAAVLRAFIAGQRMRAIVVRRPSAIRRIDEVKREVRQAFATGPFSNLVHAPESVEECWAQLPILHGSRGDSARRTSALTRWAPPASRRRLEEAAKRAVAVLEREVEDVPSSRKEFNVNSLWFVRDGQKCLDHAVTFLRRCIPALTLEQAIVAVVAPEGSEHRLLMRGANAELAAVQQTLERHDVMTATTPKTDRLPSV